jgi:hypothetical protein
LDVVVASKVLQIVLLAAAAGAVVDPQLDLGNVYDLLIRKLTPQQIMDMVNNLLRTILAHIPMEAEIYSPCLSDRNTNVSAMRNMELD